MEDKKKRDTLGTMAQEALSKAPEPLDVHEQGSWMTQDYLKNLIEAMNNFKRTHKGDFFIQVENVRHRLMHNVIRNYFIPRLSCPTPNYDQTVFQYKSKEDELFLVWTIPNREYSFKLLENAHIIDPEFKDLTKFVLDFSDGTLFKLCQKLNKEDVLEGNVVLKEIKDDERERIPVSDRIHRSSAVS